MGRDREDAFRRTFTGSSVRFFGKHRKRQNEKEFVKKLEGPRLDVCEN